MRTAQLPAYFMRDRPEGKPEMSVGNGHGSELDASASSTNMNNQDQGKQITTSCSDGATESDEPSSLIAAQQRLAMLAELGTSTSLLPTPDVLGGDDFLPVLDAVVEAWPKQKQLLAMYDHHKKWSWKQSNIRQGENKLEKETRRLYTFSCLQAHCRHGHHPYCDWNEDSFLTVFPAC